MSSATPDATQTLPSFTLSETSKVGISGSDPKVDVDFRSGCLKPVGLRVRLSTSPSLTACGFQPKTSTLLPL